MSFFAPVSTSFWDDASGPLLKRAFYHARVVGNFAFVQVAVQIIALSSGILLVRWLPQRQYAYFTLANAMQATLNMLADVGISVGLMSIGGRVWQDRHRFGELINTALAVRKNLAAVAAIFVVPILYFMLAKNGAPFFYNMVLIGVVLAGFIIQISVDVLSFVPRLHSDIKRIQSIDLTCALVRFSLIAGLVYFFTTAGVAVTIASATLLLQYLLLRNYAARVVDLTAARNADDRRAISGFVRKLAANGVFFCFQGQITVFLMGFFAHRASSIAEVGALGRLGMIFTVLTNLLGNIFIPAFARCQSLRKLRWLYLLIVGGVSAFGLVILLGAAIFPDQFLFVLGSRYTHLHRELLLVVGGAVLASLAGTFWSLNASKAWIAGAWLYIPLTLATQIALIPFTDFSNVASVLTFNLLSVVPTLFLNLVMSYRGFHDARLHGNVQCQTSPTI